MMQPVDTAILVTIVLGGILGLGGVTHLFSPLALLLAITAAVSIYPQMSELFSKVAAGGMKGPIHVLSFLVTFLMALVVFGLINRSLSAAVRLGKLEGADRILGVVVGAALAAFVAGGLVGIAGTYGGREVNEALAGSKLAPLILEFFKTLLEWAGHLLPPLEEKIL